MVWDIEQWMCSNKTQLNMLLKVQGNKFECMLFFCGQTPCLKQQMWESEVASGLTLNLILWSQVWRPRPLRLIPSALKRDQDSTGKYFNHISSDQIRSMYVLLIFSYFVILSEEKHKTAYEHNSCACKLEPGWWDFFKLM